MLETASMSQAYFGPNQAEEVSTGTTIMAAVFDNGVVLGADTRTSAGQFVTNRVSRKITRLHDRIFVCRSGSAADTQTLAAYTQKFLKQHAMEKGSLPTVNAAASLMQLLSYQNKNHLLAGTIVAGWDPTNGPQVFQIPLGGAKIPSDYAVGGSGSGYISAYVDAHYRKDMTESQCIEFVQKSIAYAISCDGSSGGMIRLFVVTPEDAKELAISGDKVATQLI